MKEFAPNLERNEDDLIWLAGFTDGEGCLHIMKHGYKDGRLYYAPD